MELEGYLTPEQAADYTRGKLPHKPEGFTPDNIRRAARKGFIPGAQRFGKRSWLLPIAGIDVWLKDEVTHRTGPKG